MATLRSKFHSALRFPTCTWFPTMAAAACHLSYHVQKYFTGSMNGSNTCVVSTVHTQREGLEMCLHTNRYPVHVHGHAERFRSTNGYIRYCRLLMVFVPHFCVILRILSHFWRGRSRSYSRARLTDSDTSSSYVTVQNARTGFVFF